MLFNFTSGCQGFHVRRKMAWGTNSHLSIGCWFFSVIIHVGPGRRMRWRQLLVKCGLQPQLHPNRPTMWCNWREWTVSTNWQNWQLVKLSSAGHYSLSSGSRDWGEWKLIQSPGAIKVVFSLPSPLKAQWCLMIFNSVTWAVAIGSEEKERREFILNFQLKYKGQLPRSCKHNLAITGTCNNKMHCTITQLALRQWISQVGRSKQTFARQMQFTLAQCFFHFHKLRFIPENDEVQLASHCLCPCPVKHCGSSHLHALRPG